MKLAASDKGVGVGPQHTCTNGGMGDLHEVKIHKKMEHKQGRLGKIQPSSTKDGLGKIKQLQQNWLETKKHHGRNHRQHNGSNTEKKRKNKESEGNKKLRMERKKTKEFQEAIAKMGKTKICTAT